MLFSVCNSGTLDYRCSPVKVRANTILTESSPESSHGGLILRTLSQLTVNSHDELTP